MDYSNVESVNCVYIITFRWGADCAGLDGHVYVVGGSDDTSRLHSVERYDISRDQWSPVPPMSTARNGVGVTAVGGKKLYNIDFMFVVYVCWWLIDKVRSVSYQLTGRKSNLIFSIIKIPYRTHSSLDTTTVI